LLEPCRGVVNLFRFCFFISVFFQVKKSLFSNSMSAHRSRSTSPAAHSHGFTVRQLPSHGELVDPRAHDAEYDAMLLPRRTSLHKIELTSEPTPSTAPALFDSSTRHPNTKYDHTKQLSKKKKAKKTGTERVIVPKKHLPSPRKASKEGTGGDSEAAAIEAAATATDLVEKEALRAKNESGLSSAQMENETHENEVQKEEEESEQEPSLSGEEASSEESQEAEEKPRSVTQLPKEQVEQNPSTISASLLGQASSIVSNLIEGASTMLKPASADESELAAEKMEE